MKMIGKCVALVVVLCATILASDALGTRVFAASGVLPGARDEVTTMACGSDLLLSREVRAVRAETSWRINLYELDHGRWRYAGAFENPDRDRCVRYGEAWKRGKPGHRMYTAPVAFRR
jgi:hypothetical protein